MSYFSKFPLIVYPLTHDGKTLVPYTLTDIVTRVKFDMPEKDMLSITEPYQIMSGETPESISYKIYGTPYYHWVIMFTNNIFDYISDWYMTEEQVQEFAKTKYGEGHVNDVAYKTDPYGNVVSVGDPSLTTFMGNSLFDDIKYTGEIVEVTNMMHELLQNNKKQLIRVIRPEYINSFINKFTQQLNG